MEPVMVQGKRHGLWLRTREIENLERKERKERQEEIYRALGCAGSWRFGLVKVHFACVREIDG